MKISTTFRFIISTSLVLNANLALATATPAAVPTKTEAFDVSNCPACQQEMLNDQLRIMGLAPIRKSIPQKGNVTASPDHQAITEIKNQVKDQSAKLDEMRAKLNSIAETCTTDKIQQIIDLSSTLNDPENPSLRYTLAEGSSDSLAKAGLHTNINWVENKSPVATKIVVTPEQDQMLQNFYSSAAMKNYADCKKQAASLVQLACVDLPEREREHSTLSQLFKNLVQADSRNKEQADKAKTHKKFVRLQHDCKSPNALFATIDTILNDSELTDPTHRVVTHPRSIYALQHVVKKHSSVRPPQEVAAKSIEEVPVAQPLAIDFSSTTVAAPGTADSN